MYKLGKYVRWFWTPPAKDLERLPELGYHVLEMIWGDKVWENEGPSSSRYGTATQLPPKAKGAKGIEESVKAIFAVVGLGGTQVCRRARTWS